MYGTALCEKHRVYGVSLKNPQSIRCIPVHPPLHPCWREILNGHFFIYFFFTFKRYFMCRLRIRAIYDQGRMCVQELRVYLCKCTLKVFEGQFSQTTEVKNTWTVRNFQSLGLKMNTLTSEFCMSFLVTNQFWPNNTPISHLLEIFTIKCECCWHIFFKLEMFVIKWKYCRNIVYTLALFFLPTFTQY